MFFATSLQTFMDIDLIPPWPPLLQAEQLQFSQPSWERCCSHFTTFMTLHWALSSMSMSLLHWEERENQEREIRSVSHAPDSPLDANHRPPFSPWPTPKSATDQPAAPCEPELVAWEGAAPQSPLLQLIHPRKVTRMLSA